MEYLRDPKAIYAESFAIVAREADLSGLPAGARDLAVRLIHACGMLDIVDDLLVSPGAVSAGRAALAAGAPVICDTEMVRQGIIVARLPANNQLLCGLHAEAPANGSTRAAAGIEALADRLGAAVVAIGNAPTALFRLLELIDQGAPKPALIVGLPVGFVGAAESKAELAADPRGVPFVTLEGRRGGSALAAAAVNALAAEAP